MITQEEKQLLLLKDLCARLLYNVMVDYENHIYVLNEIDPACKDIDYITVRIQDVERLMCAKNVMIEHIKPYLRSIDSMTEEEREELKQVALVDNEGVPGDIPAYIDWLNKKMFDYRGLIPMGLAIQVTKENNPYE